jgi:hypothetical protein
MVFLLRRLDYNFLTDQTTKLNDRVTFGHSLNMWPYTSRGVNDNEDGSDTSEGPAYHSSECQYELKGVIVHSEFPKGGHYISFVKGEDGRWFEFNDNVVTPFYPDNTQNGLDARCFGGGNKKTGNAYMLFYHRRPHRSPPENIHNPTTDYESNDAAKGLHRQQLHDPQQMLTNLDAEVKIYHTLTTIFP